jgi:hypothetical protein
LGDANFAPHQLEVKPSMGAAPEVRDYDKIAEFGGSEDETQIMIMSKWFLTVN